MSLLESATRRVPDLSSGSNSKETKQKTPDELSPIQYFALSLIELSEARSAPSDFLKRSPIGHRNDLQARPSRRSDGSRAPRPSNLPRIEIFSPIPYPSFLAGHQNTLKQKLLLDFFWQ